MRKLVLRTRFSVGDVVMMTAAVRDLHRCYPGQFQTDVRTHFPELWEHNPHLTCLDEKAEDVEVLDCRYPLIDHADYRPYHCLHGYIEFLNEKLDLRIVPTEFRGDIHLAPEEREWASQVHEVAGRDIPFWIVAAGGKHDITIKWWSTDRYQAVINHFRGRIAFVQIGEYGHHHPKLDHTIDLRGQTSLRELIRLVHHAQGCLSSVTALMHLAAAVATRRGRPPNRAAVVVAGGREPPSWEAYPHHQFLHTVGMLPCCRQGGCWKARFATLGDGDARDRPTNLCTNLGTTLPRCMEMITPAHVIHAIEGYFTGGAVAYLTNVERVAARRAIRASRGNPYDRDSLSRYNAPSVLERAIAALPEYPSGFSGRGIVICGGGLRYFPCAWVCINMLRHVGCQLPIQFWYQGGEEMDARMLRLLRELDVECVDARAMERRHPRRITGGWELKAYAMLHCRFQEALFLDADNVPVKDPSFLFETTEYQRTGALFWPDYGCLGPKREIWAICGLSYRAEPEFETGQMLVDKRRCWRALNLAFWFNDHSEFFFRYIHGDKETFHLAWLKLGQAYTMVATPIESLQGVMCQHDLQGERLFQHRNSHKWRAFGANKRIRGFKMEGVCLRYLRELEERWDGHIHLELAHGIEENGFLFRGGTCDRNVFHDVCEKNEYQLPEQFDARDVIIDVGAHIGSFSYACLQRGARRVLAFEPERENFRLAQHNLRWFGKRVRLHAKAVWRSDQRPGLLLHSGYPQCDVTVNTGGGSVLLTAESSPAHRKKELVAAIALDAVLRPFARVRLLKLDCEGSEWPILLTSKLLSRVQSVCGEFHELDVVPSAARVRGHDSYTKNDLEKFLRERYEVVRIQSRADSVLGHFWAERPMVC